MSSEKNEKITIVLAPDVLKELNYYAFSNEIRSKNTAAKEIITDFINEWVERGRPS